MGPRYADYRAVGLAEGARDMDTVIRFSCCHGDGDNVGVRR